ncbi:MAG: hypothetical protein EOP51_20820, partial [Sphingobacteriales bacterium]
TLTSKTLASAGQAGIDVDAYGYIYLSALNSTAIPSRRYNPDLSQSTSLGSISSAFDIEVTNSGKVFVSKYITSTAFVQKINFGAPTLTGTPTLSDIGVHNVSIKAENGADNATQSFAISVTTPPGNALNFDGTNDRVTIPNTGQVNFGTGDFTVETWVNATPASFGTILSTTAPSTLDGLALYLNAGNVYLRVNGSTYTNTTRKIDDGRWHHVAGARTSGVVRFYVDGELIYTSGGLTGTVTTTGNLVLGYNPGLGSLIGSLDDVRLYNIGLTAAQIQADRTSSTSILPANLVGSYNFDQGVAGGNNAGMTTLYDQSTLANNGTLTNLTLTGNTSNYVTSYAEIAPVSTAATNVTNSGFTANWTAPAMGTADSYRLDISTSPVFQTFLPNYNSVTINGTSAVITDLKPGINHYYRVRAYNNALALEGGNSLVITTATPAPVAPGNALHFDGIDDQVNIPNTGQTNFGTGDFTIGTWFKTTSSGTIFNTKGFSGGGITIKVETNGRLLIEINGGGISPLSIANDGKWHHAGFIRRSGTVEVYLDGVWLYTGANAFSATSALPIVLGNNAFDERFTGNIDEIRVYNTALTASELQADRLSATSVKTGSLVAHYKFDSGTAGGNNAGIITLHDQSTAGNNGTLTNFALSGTTSNWAASFAEVLPSILAATNVNNSGFTANWAAPTIGTPDGYYLDVSTSSTFASFLPDYNGVTVTGTSQLITNLKPGTNHYYRVRAFSNTAGESIYSATILAATTALTAPGNALALDGTDDRAITTETAAFNFGTGDFTVEAWVKTSNTSALDFVALGNSIGGDEYWLGMRSLRPQFTVSGVGVYGTANLNDGKWHHLAGVRYAGEMYLYVDGVLQGATPNGNSVSPNGGLTIGALSNNTLNWIGMVDEARVYNTNLTLAQIQAEMKSASSVLPGNLVAHYSMDHGTAGATNTGITTLYDRSANGFNAILAGSALTGTASNFIASYAMVVPTATAATLANNSSFTANWTASAVGTATSYRLDVSASPVFAVNLPGYDNLTVSGLTQVVTNLLPGTTYYYRV